RSPRNRLPAPAEGQHRPDSRRAPGPTRAASLAQLVFLPQRAQLLGDDTVDELGVAVAVAVHGVHGVLLRRWISIAHTTNGNARKRTAGLGRLSSLAMILDLWSLSSHQSKIIAMVGDGNAPERTGLARPAVELGWRRGRLEPGHEPGECPIGERQRDVAVRIAALDDDRRRRE